MPKATITFTLPEEKDDYYLANNGMKMYSILWEFDQWLRQEIKWGDKPYDDIRQKLYDIMNEENFSFNEVS